MKNMIFVSGSIIGEIDEIRRYIEYIYISSFTKYTTEELEARAKPARYTDPL